MGKENKDSCSPFKTLSDLLPVRKLKKEKSRNTKERRKSLRISGSGRKEFQFQKVLLSD